LRLAEQLKFLDAEAQMPGVTAILRAAFLENAGRIGHFSVLGRIHDP
jgi:hypothetical protein